MITLSLDLRGVEELQKKNAKFGRSLTAMVIANFRSTVGRTMGLVIDDLRTKSRLSRKIWGQNPSGLMKQGLVSRIRPYSEGNIIATGIRLRGIPAILERGGRLKPHKIQGKREHGYLVFPGRPRDEWSETTLVFTKKKVKHPGAVVMPHGFGGSALRRNERLIADGVNGAIRRTVELVYG